MPKEAMAGESVSPATTPPAPASGAGTSVAADALKALQSSAGTAPASGAAPAATPGTNPPATTPDPKAAAPTPATAAGEIKLTAPKDSGLDEPAVAKIAEFAKANGLSQAQAEKLLDQKAADAASAKAAADKAIADNLSSLAKVESDGRAAWAKDPDFGGTKLQESNIDVARALSKHAPVELQKFLSDHPYGKALGSDPAFLKMMASVGRSLREDSGGGPPGAPPAPRAGMGSLDDMASALYPNGQMTPDRAPRAI